MNTEAQCDPKKYAGMIETICTHDEGSALFAECEYQVYCSACTSLDKPTIDHLAFDAAAPARGGQQGKQAACACACACVALDFCEPVLNLNCLELAGFSLL